MNQSLNEVDRLIKEKLDKINNHSNINPFYITPEEIENLINSETGDIDSDSLQLITHLFSLNEIEKNILKILFAFEIHPKYEKIFAYLQDDLNKKYPTIALFSFLFSEKSDNYEIIQLFSEDFPLLKFGLVKLIDNNGEETPIIHRPIKLEESIKKFLIGIYPVDREIVNYIKTVPPVDNPQIRNLKLKNTIKEGKHKFIFNLHGKNKSKKEKYALKISSINNYGLFIVDGEVINSQSLTKKVLRDALLNGCSVYFKNFDFAVNKENYKNIMDNLYKQIQKFSWLIFFDTEKPYGFYIEDFLFIDEEFKPFDKEESFKLWEKHTELDKETIKELSNIFIFDERQIKQISKKIDTQKIIGDVDKKTVYKICRRIFSNELDSFAKKIETDFKFNDIILPEKSLNQLKSIITHYKFHYEIFESWGFRKKISNQSISALFTGSPGTGKTMAVSILGNELGIDVYRIDLSKVVSKYIGETEKNLSKIFDSAENSGVILFFDEADALFGKRTEIRDSHDRYANIEISYLLQRIEDYKGIVILATNFRKNIDEAFSRRIRFIIDFPIPDEKMRYEIWKKAFPEETPLSKDINFKFLSKNFKFSGANIKNAALYSAFYAVEENSEIKMEHILKGIKTELQKTGKNIKQVELLKKELENGNGFV